MNIQSHISMNDAFAKLKKGKTITLELKNYNEVVAWENAFKKQASSYDPYITNMSCEWRRGHYHLSIKRDAIIIAKTSTAPLHKIKHAVSEEQAEKNFLTLCEHIPKARVFIKELYEANLIPGIRSIVKVERNPHNTENAEIKQEGLKKCD